MIKQFLHQVNLIIIVKVMNNEVNLQQASGEFQQLREEVLTYSLSQQIPTSPVNKSRKNIKSKNQEKHKLQLIIRQNIQTFKEFDIKTANQNIKKIESGRGKIIPIGSTIFKSNFECGNICSATLVAPNTFEIHLQKETNSNRRSAWFYFSVEGIKGEAHFIIKGFTKSSSLYNEGMKVCYRDTKQLSKWRRGGTRISYTATDQDELEQKGQKKTYELRFSYFFKNNEHTCIEFAYCFPYGLKKLYSMIGHFKDQLSYQALAKSFSNLDIPLLTIGNKESEEVIILSARVHPGETVSSFIMEGFLKELLGDNQYGRMLRTNYLFKIVPMLNPDGVARGNYRFSAYGCDLNRKWKTCKENSQPQIYYMKQLIRKTNKEKKVIMYIDIHGHSRKKNVFFYGCCEKGQDDNIINPKAKEFPFLMEKISDAFKYQNCCFNVQKDKDGTARITVWKELKIDYVYTLQSSFCGPEYGVNYLQNDYEKIGKKLCEGVAVFFYSSISKSKSHDFKGIEKLALLKEKAILELNENLSLLHVGDQDDSGSQSQPQIGQIGEKDRNPDSGIPKPQAIHKQAKTQLKTKQSHNPSKQFYSQSLISEKKHEKLKSESAQVDESKNVRILSEKISKKQQQTFNSEFTLIDPPKFDRVEIKFANTLNTFELQSLRASALYHKNVRVHSFTKNKERFTSRSKRVVNPFCEQIKEIKEEKERMKINLMHDRQGVQYRRVRKIAEQNQKKQMVVSEMENSVVKQLAGNQLFMGQSQRSNKISTMIAPRFFPVSQQKNRRTSIDVFIKKLSRNNQIKKANGDQIHGRSIGRQVFI